MVGAFVYFAMTADYRFHCHKESYTHSENVAAILGCLLVFFIMVCIVFTKVDSELFSSERLNPVIQSDPRLISRERLNDDPEAVKYVTALLRYLNSKGVPIGLVGLSVAVIGAVAWVDGVKISSEDLSSNDSHITSPHCRKVQLVKYYFYPSVVQFAFLVLIFLRKFLESNGKSHRDGESYSNQNDKSWMVPVLIGSVFGLLLIAYLGFGIGETKHFSASTVETDLETTSVPKFIWFRLYAQIVLLSFSLSCCIVCFCFICKFHDRNKKVSKDSGDQRNAEHSPDLDDLLIIVTAAVITAHCTLDLVADSSCLSLKACYGKKDNDKHTYLRVEIFQLVWNILQPILQSGILLKMKKMTLETKNSKMCCKDCLEILLWFLFVANMIWVFDLWLFDIQKIRWKKVFLAERSVYDNKPWLIISNFYYPVVIFFRVHSSLVLIQLIFRLRGETQQRDKTE
jgi:hypothetical protein